MYVKSRGRGVFFMDTNNTNNYERKKHSFFRDDVTNATFKIYKVIRDFKDLNGNKLEFF